MYTLIFKFRTPTEKEIQDYDLSLINAIRSSDITQLKLLYNDGKR